MVDLELVKQAKHWIALSESDLKSSRLLYFADVHHSSYFHFQQAVEKANKAFALFLGFSENDLKKTISHDQMKIYKKVITDRTNDVRKIIERSNFQPTLKYKQLLKPFDFHEYHRSLLETLNTLQSLRNEDLVYLSAHEINYCLDAMDDAEDASTTIEFPKSNDLEFKEFLNNMSDLWGQIEVNPGEITKSEFDNLITSDHGSLVMHKVFRYGLQQILAVTHFESVFFLCAILTIQHSSLSRYIDGEKNPLKIYTKKLPLVRKQIEIMDTFDSALQKFKKYVSSNP